MHELSIVRNLIEAVDRRIGEHPDRPVLRIRIRVGDLRQVIPETMVFCYEVATKGTRLEGSRLDIEHVPIRAQCRRCGLRFEVEEMIFLCPQCGVAEVETLSGNELELLSIELGDAGGSTGASETNEDGNPGS